MSGRPTDDIMGHVIQAGRVTVVLVLGVRAVWVPVELTSRGYVVREWGARS